MPVTLKDAFEYVRRGDVLFRVRDYDRHGVLLTDTEDFLVAESEVRIGGEVIAFAEIDGEHVHTIRASSVERDGDEWTVEEEMDDGRLRRLTLSPAWTPEHLRAYARARVLGPRAGIVEQLTEAIDGG